jgi:hypothetical protein
MAGRRFKTALEERSMRAQGGIWGGIIEPLGCGFAAFEREKAGGNCPCWDLEKGPKRPEKICKSLQMNNNLNNILHLIFEPLFLSARGLQPTDQETQ